MHLTISTHDYLKIEKELKNYVFNNYDIDEFITLIDDDNKHFFNLCMYVCFPLFPLLLKGRVVITKWTILTCHFLNQENLSFGEYHFKLHDWLSRSHRVLRFRTLFRKVLQTQALFHSRLYFHSSIITCIITSPWLTIGRTINCQVVVRP